MKPMRMSDVGWCRAMRDAFAQHGLDVDALLVEAGVDLARADEVELGTLTDGFSHAWEIAVARSGDPGIGLTLPSHPLHSLGMLSHVVLSSSNVKSALQALARFTHLISPTASIEIEADGERCVLALQIAAGQRPVPPQRYDFTLTVLLRGLHWVTGREIKPIVLHHPGPLPADPARWQRAFGCPVRFGAPACRIELAMNDLALPIPTADPAVARAALSSNRRPGG